MSTIQSDPFVLVYDLCDHSQKVKNYDSSSIVSTAMARSDFRMFEENGKKSAVMDPPPHVVSATLKFGMEIKHHEVSCRCQLAQEQRARRVS